MGIATRRGSPGKSIEAGLNDSAVYTVSKSRWREGEGKIFESEPVTDSEVPPGQVHQSSFVTSPITSFLVTGLSFVRTPGLCIHSLCTTFPPSCVLLCSLPAPIALIVVSPRNWRTRRHKPSFYSLAVVLDHLTFLFFFGNISIHNRHHTISRHPWRPTTRMEAAQSGQNRTTCLHCPLESIHLPSTFANSFRTIPTRSNIARGLPRPSSRPSKIRSAGTRNRTARCVLPLLETSR